MYSVMLKRNGRNEIEDDDDGWFCFCPCNMEAMTRKSLTTTTVM